MFVLLITQHRDIGFTIYNIENFFVIQKSYWEPANKKSIGK